MRSLIKVMALVAVMVCNLCSCGSGSSSGSGSSNSIIDDVTKKTKIRVVSETYSSLEIILYTDGTCHSEGTYRASGVSFRDDENYIHKCDTYHDITKKWLQVFVHNGYQINLLDDGYVYASMDGSCFEHMEAYKSGTWRIINED